MRKVTIIIDGSRKRFLPLFFVLFLAYRSYPSYLLHTFNGPLVKVSPYSPHSDSFHVYLDGKIDTPLSNGEASHQSFLFASLFSYPIPDRLMSERCHLRNRDWVLLCRTLHLDWVNVFEYISDYW